MNHEQAEKLERLVLELEEAKDKEVELQNELLKQEQEL